MAAQAIDASTHERTCKIDTPSAAHIREYCEVDEVGKSLMRAARRSVQLGMSAR